MLCSSHFAQFFLASVLVVRCLVVSGRAFFDSKLFPLLVVFVSGQAIEMAAPERRNVVFLIANFRWPPRNAGMFFWSRVVGVRQ